MDSISNNYYSPSSSQSHRLATGYLSGRDLFTHFANFNSHDSSKSKLPIFRDNLNTSNTNSTSNTPAIQTQLKLNSALLDETSVPLNRPAYHLSESPLTDTRRSPVDDQVERTPTSSSVVHSSSFRHYPRRLSSPPHSLETSLANGLEPSQHQSATSSVFCLTQSELQKIMHNSDSFISTEEITKANNLSQLYLLVPSNYPVLMAVGAECDKTSLASLTTVNEATAPNLLERFQLTATSISQQQQQQNSAPSPQMTVEQQPQSLMHQQKQSVMPRAPRKNSTNIPPMLLQSLKAIVPSLAFGNSTSAGDKKKSIDSTAVLLTSPPRRPQGPPSASISSSSSFMLEDSSDIKTMAPPPLSSPGQSVDVVPFTDSNTFFSNDTSPRHSYIGGISGGGGGGGDGVVDGVATSCNHPGDDSRDVRRRVSHNEIERRRRDRINTWIAELYKLLPPEQQTKSQYQSKGVVLKRVCEYFQKYDSTLKALREENAVYKQQVCRLTRENNILCDSLNAHFQQQQQQRRRRQSTSDQALMSPNSKTPSPSKRSHFSSD